jgi:hypothetical protein
MHGVYEKGSQILACLHVLNIDFIDKTLIEN